MSLGSVIRDPCQMQRATWWFFSEHTHRTGPSPTCGKRRKPPPTISAVIAVLLTLTQPADPPFSEKTCAPLWRIISDIDVRYRGKPVSLIFLLIPSHLVKQTYNIKVSHFLNFPFPLNASALFPAHTVCLLTGQWIAL